MDFCDCGGIFVPISEGKSKCRNCNKFSNLSKEIKIKTQNKKQETIVIENNEPDLPTTDKLCEKCSNEKAFYWLIQTRSSDEPPTQFFKCTKCRHVWREYK